MDHFLQLAIAGLASGAIYTMVALSYNIVFAATGVLNFAQGQLIMAGTMIGVFLYGTAGFPLWIALLLTLLAGTVIAMAEDLFAIRPAIRRGKSALGWVLATLGFGIALQAVFSLTMGPQRRAFPEIVDESPRTVAGAIWTAYDLALVTVALVTGLALLLFYDRTLIGRAFGAVAQDEAAARMRGIPVQRLWTVSFAMSGALAAGTGFLAAPHIGASPSLGFDLALKGFIAAALGGIPLIRGAVVGGLALGLIETFSADWIGPGYRTAVIFLVLLLVLTVKPSGLFGRTVRTV